MIGNLRIWSEVDKAIVSWTVALETETDEGGNVSSVIIARHGDEVHRFSPSHTDEELQRRADEMNQVAQA